jgi:hypothetical protein
MIQVVGDRLDRCVEYICSLLPAKICAQERRMRIRADRRGSYVRAKWKKKTLHLCDALRPLGSICWSEVCVSDRNLRVGRPQSIHLGTRAKWKNVLYRVPSWSCRACRRARGGGPPRTPHRPSQCTDSGHSDTRDSQCDAMRAVGARTPLITDCIRSVP